MYNFSLDREFSLKSYVSHSTQSSPNEITESISEPDPPSIPIKTVEPQPSVNETNDTMFINLLFSSDIRITGWHFEYKNKVNYFKINNRGRTFTITSKNKIFEKIHVNFYEDCLASMEYNGKVKFVACKEPDKKKPVNN